MTRFGIVCKQMFRNADPFPQNGNSGVFMKGMM